jgi:hypothetical protein
MSKTSVVVNVVAQCKNKVRLLSSNDVSSKTSFVVNVVVQCNHYNYNICLTTDVVTR